MRTSEEKLKEEKERAASEREKLLEKILKPESTKAVINAGAVSTERVETTARITAEEAAKRAEMKEKLPEKEEIYKNALYAAESLPQEKERLIPKRKA